MTTKAFLQLMAAAVLLSLLLGSCSRPQRNSSGMKQRGEVIYYTRRETTRAGPLPPPFNVALLASGEIVRCKYDGPELVVERHDLEGSAAGPLLSRSRELRLLQQPPGMYFPPDSSFDEIGIRSYQNLRIYAWNGQDYNLPLGRRVGFRSAWDEAMEFLGPLEQYDWRRVDPAVATAIADQLQ